MADAKQINPNDLIPDRIEVHFHEHLAHERFILEVTRRDEGDLSFKVNGKPIVAPDEDANRSEFYCRDMARLIANYLNRSKAR